MKVVDIAKTIRITNVVYINPNGYIGESTRSEINHAKSLNKLIRYLEPEPIQISPCFCL